MTLAVETGTGSASAEAYATVAEANTFHTDRGLEAEWTDLDEEVKERALRKATDYMQQEYRTGWAGERKSTTQALDWPRYAVPMRDAPGGAFYDPDSIPAEVKRACMQLAYRALSTDLNPDIGPLKTRAKVGPIEVEYAEGSRQTTLYTAVDALLAPLMRGGRSATGIGVVRA